MLLRAGLFTIHFYLLPVDLVFPTAERIPPAGDREATTQLVRKLRRTPDCTPFAPQRTPIASDLESLKERRAEKSHWHGRHDHEYREPLRQTLTIIVQHFGTVDACDCEDAGPTEYLSLYLFQLFQQFYTCGFDAGQPA